MTNTSTKFDQEAHNGTVSMVFTRSTDGRMEGRTEPQQRYYIHRNGLRRDNKGHTRLGKQRDGKVDYLHTTCHKTFILQEV